jgi:hypothetical protein
MAIGIDMLLSRSNPSPLIKNFVFDPTDAIKTIARLVMLAPCSPYRSIFAGNRRLHRQPGLLSSHQMMESVRVDIDGKTVMNKYSLSGADSVVSNF